jgi:archaellum biogenesis protein FlaJ (TadC family)
MTMTHEKYFPLFCRLYRKLYYKLFLESDGPQAPEQYRAKPRRIIHNAVLIQTWAALAGILSIGSIPIVILLITAPHFVIGYLVFCAVAGTFMCIMNEYVRRVNKREENLEANF